MDQITKISIITINLNNRIGLEQTFASVVSQTYSNIEWIIIDGGSKDGSREFLKENEKDIFYWVSENDTGIYNAMNKGINKATGDYILFLNSGDYLLNEGVIASVVPFLENKDIVYGSILMSIGGSIRRSLAFNHKSILLPKDLIDHPMPHPATFFKRSLFDIVGLYDESLKIVADRKFYIQAIIWNNATVKYVPLEISFFDGGGISSTPRGLEERQRLLNEFFPPLVREDIKLATSLRDVLRSRIGRLMYSIIYRISTWNRKNED